MEKITEIQNYKSSLFQYISLQSFNELKIGILYEPVKLFEPENFANLDIEDIESLFVQFYTVNDFLNTNRISFINFNKFEIFKNESYISVKFEIQLSDFDSNSAINILVDLFRNHKYFCDLSFSNIHDKYLNLLQGFKKIDELYIYKYNEFSSNFLNLYNIENIKKSSNTAIKIVTENNVLNKIIKSSLYSNLYSNNFFFYNIEEGTDNLLEYIVRNNQNDFNNKKYDFIEVIGVLEDYILKSSIRSVIFFVDRILDIEEESFFKYLLTMTKIKNIVLVSFNIDIGGVFDVELNEFPENYFYDKTLFESENINSSDNLKKPIKKNSDDIPCIDEIIDINNNSVTNLLKIAEIYRKNKDYNNLFKTLERFPKNIPDENKSHYYYLNYYYKDRFIS